MKEIEIIIDKDGKIKTEAFGFIGENCSEFTEKLAEKLGLILEKERKPEYYEQEQLRINQKG